MCVRTALNHLPTTPKSEFTEEEAKNQGGPGIHLQSPGWRATHPHHPTQAWKSHFQLYHNGKSLPESPTRCSIRPLFSAGHPQRMLPSQIRAHLLINVQRETARAGGGDRQQGGQLLDVPSHTLGAGGKEEGLALSTEFLSWPTRAVQCWGRGGF